MTISRNALITTIAIISIFGGVAFGGLALTSIVDKDWGGAILFFGFFVLCCFYLWEVPKMRRRQKHYWGFD